MPVGNGVWSADERSAFVDAMFSFDVYSWRWLDILKRANLRRSVQEAKLYALGVLQQCVKASGDRTREKFQFALNSVRADTPNHRDMKPDPSLADGQFVMEIYSKLAVWARRITVLRKLSAIAAQGDLSNVSIPAIEKKPNTWWQHSDNNTLLYAVHKHGIAASLIENDLTLHFSIREGAARSNAEASAQPDAQAVDGEAKDASMSSVGSSSSSESSSESNEALSDQWPDARAITAHLKRTIDAVFKANAQLKQAVKTHIEAQHEQAKSSVHENKTRYWSVEEFSDFRTEVLRNGAGLWDAIKERAQLKSKTVEQVELLGEVFLYECERVANKFPLSGQPLPDSVDFSLFDFSNFYHAGTLFEKSDSASFPKELERLLTSHTPLHVDAWLKLKREQLFGIAERREASTQTIADPLEAESILRLCFSISPIHAHKIIKLTQLSNAIHRCVETPEIGERLGTAQKLYMPAWWEPEMDFVCALCAHTRALTLIVSRCCCTSLIDAVSGAAMARL